MAFSIGRTVTGTTDTPTTSDDGGMLQYTSASAKTITLTNSSWIVGRSALAFDISGGGAATFVAGAGVTLDGDTTAPSGTVPVWYYRAANVWKRVGPDFPLPVSAGGTGATTAAGARRELQIQGPAFNPIDFGAVGDASTNDSAAFQAAMDAAEANNGYVWVEKAPAGNYYRITSPLRPYSGMRILGNQTWGVSATVWTAPYLVATTGGLFEQDSNISSGLVSGLGLMTFGASGAHVWATAGYSLSHLVVEHGNVHVYGNGSSFFNNIGAGGGGDVSWSRFHQLDWYDNRPAPTVPFFNARPEGFGFNANEIGWIVAWGYGGCGQPAIRIEDYSAAPNGWTQDAWIHDITFQFWPGRQIELRACREIVIERIYDYDVHEHPTQTTHDADRIVIGRGTGGNTLFSKGITLRQVVRRGSSMDPGVVDIKLESGGGVQEALIDGCNGFVDFGDNPATVINPSSSAPAYTASNQTTSTVEVKAGMLDDVFSGDFNTSGSFWQTPGRGMTSVNVFTPTAGTTYYEPFVVGAPATLDAVAVGPTGGSGGATCLLGLCRADADGQPTATGLLWQATVSTATAGMASTTTGLPITLAPGRYVLIARPSAAQTYRNVNSVIVDVATPGTGANYLTTRTESVATGALANPVAAWTASSSSTPERRFIFAQISYID